MFILYHDSHLRCLPLLTQLSWSPFAVRHKSASSSLAHLRSLYHITFLHSIFFRNFTHIFSFLWIKLHKLISACHFYSPIHFQNIFRNLWFLHIPNILLSHFFDIVIRVKAKTFHNILFHTYADRSPFLSAPPILRDISTQAGSFMIK